MNVAVLCSDQFSQTLYTFEYLKVTYNGMPTNKFSGFKNTSIYEAGVSNCRHLIYPFLV